MREENDRRDTGEELARVHGGHNTHTHPASSCVGEAHAHAHAQSEGEREDTPWGNQGRARRGGSSSARRRKVRSAVRFGSEVSGARHRRWRSSPGMNRKERMRDNASGYVVG